MMKTRGYAALERGGRLEPFAFERREPGPRDVVLTITHCGVCHSDLHAVNDDWKGTRYPLVPGHEIVGTVASVGDSVTTLAVGDTAAIGCLVNSCQECAACQAGDEHFCEKRATPTYGGLERGLSIPTYGGYSDRYVVDARFAPRVPASLDPAAAAPLLCAGITTYSPLRHWKVGPGMTVGVVGLGGLGHMAVKFGKAFGARVVQFTTSPGKADAARALGADEVVLTTDPSATRPWAGKLDFIIDTVSAPHDLNPLLGTLRRDGTMCLVGMPDRPAPVAPARLVNGRRSLSGSMIGGLRETQEMLDFCAEHSITSEIEPIAMDQINEAYVRMLNNDVRYRFVIDMATL